MLAGRALSAGLPCPEVIIVLANRYWPPTPCQALLSLPPFFTWENRDKGNSSDLPPNYAANRKQSWGLDPGRVVTQLHQRLLLGRPLLWIASGLSPKGRESRFSWKKGGPS